MEVQLKLNSTPNPIILTCPQGLPTTYEDVELLSIPGQDILEPKTKKKLRLSNNELLWEAKNEAQKTKILVGVLDKQKTVTLTPILMQGTLSQKIKKQMKEYQARNTALEEGLTQFQQRKLVAEEMGTNKSKRKMRQLETNKVQEENIAEAEAIKEKFEQKKQEIRDQISLEKEIHLMEENQLKEELLPEFSKGKVPTHQIYNIKSIISDEDMECLDTSKMQIYLSTKKEDLIKHYNPYVQNLLQTYQFDKNTKQIVLKYIEFLNILLKFQYKQTIQNSTPIQIMKELYINDIQLVNSIINKFYQTTKGTIENTYNFNRSSFLKDKYICYIIVLHLFIHKFKFDAAPLAKLLKMDLKKLSNYTKQCNCTGEQKNGQLMITLRPFVQKGKQ